MNFTSLTELASFWKQTAAELRRYGAADQASALDECAEDLLARLREWEMEPLTMDAAEAESGYSRSTLERRLATGAIENAGQKGAPRILRRDLPLKGGTDGPSLTTPDGLPDLAEELLNGGLS